MRLRTLIGAYRGQVQDYPYRAGLNALRSGSAEAVEPQAFTRTTPPNRRPTRPSRPKRTSAGAE
jgi:hypothetical protein